MRWSMPWPDAMRVSPLGTSQNLTGMPCKIWLPSSLNHRPQAIFLDAFIDRFRDRIGNEMNQYASQSVESRASTVGRHHREAQTNQQPRAVRRQPRVVDRTRRQRLSAAPNQQGKTDSDQIAITTSASQ